MKLHKIFPTFCAALLLAALLLTGCGESFPFDYTGMSDAEILLSDCEFYSIGGKKVAVACVGTKNDDDQRVTVAKMGMAMEDYAGEKHADTVFTLVKNYHDGTVDLAFYGAGAAEAAKKLFGENNGFSLTLSKEITREELVAKLRTVME